MTAQILITYNKKSFIPAVASGIKWSLKRRSTPGKLTFTIIDDKKFEIGEGAAVNFQYNKQKIFFGFIFSLQRKKDGTIDVVAYDQLRYLKNKDTIVYSGKTASVYCSTYWFTNFVDEKVRAKRPTWIADYRGECGYKGEYGIWQYDAAEVPGVQYDCDRDWGYVDYSEYIKSHHLNGYAEIVGGVKKSVDELAREVINGKWSCGQERYDKLTAAGYSYDDVQKRVNEILGTPAKKSITEIADEVIQGKWGNGDERYKKLTESGYNYEQVQRAVNQKLHK